MHAVDDALAGRRAHAVRRTLEFAAHWMPVPDDGGRAVPARLWPGAWDLAA